jgi:prolyl oligopeptidase
MTKPTYPAARRLDLRELLPVAAPTFDVADPYRWLEDPATSESLKWLEEEDSLATAHLSALAGRLELRSRLTSLMAAGVVTAPAWRGQRQFFMRRTADQEHAVLVTVDPDGTERTLLDPMRLDPAGTTTLDAWQPSKEGELLAYQISQGGDEESILRVIDVESGEIVDGPIDRCRYSPVGWLPGAQSYYYVRRLPASQVPAGEEQFHRRVWLYRPRDRRMRVRRRLRQDHLLLGIGQPRRSLAHRERLARHCPAQRSVDRRPHDVRPRIATTARTTGRRRCTNLRACRTRRPCLHLHRP